MHLPMKCLGQNTGLTAASRVSLTLDPDLPLWHMSGMNACLVSSWYRHHVSLYYIRCLGAIYTLHKTANLLGKILVLGSFSCELDSHNAQPGSRTHYTRSATLMFPIKMHCSTMSRTIVGVHTWLSESSAKSGVCRRFFACQCHC